MAIKGGRRHLKRIAVPKAWPTVRKERTFIAKPAPGAHKIEISIALVTLIKEMLKLTDTTTEARKIIKQKQIMVNEKSITDPKFAVGFMDVVTILTTKKHYRMLLSAKGKLELREIPEENCKFILSKVSGKKILKKGKVQLNFEDGRNHIVEKGVYKTGDVIKFQIPEQKILEHYELKKGNIAYITSGKHAGKTGIIEEIIPGSAQRRSEIILKSGKDTFQTLKKYVFVIGKDKPVISIGDKK